ncbi:ABC transporter transmembrane domain-containing protein [Photobacterium alginatilyticum]|uniref:ATP-binding cassette domain-containing protein n=1 Tax=Photobacterium alginatilyticum TaxID=1775171 RepID=A0ABW9YMM7_9GAMM|nr:ABC transporter transmembrane domain-containing protein [Photobacterium alginatilyticum]NBI55089.1 ATP-binding cassette domain-containing protein [Photobacterium alginatilyticum]
MSHDKSDSTQQIKALNPLLPILRFVKPYKTMVAAALLALLVTAVVSLSIGQGVKMIIDNGFMAGSKEQLSHAIGVMVVMISILAVGTFTRFYLMSWLGERVCADIRKAVFDRLLALHPSYFEENRSGEIMSRLTTDTTLLQSIIGSSFSMALRSLLMLVGGLLMLVLTNLKLTLMVVGCVPVVLLPMLYYGRKVRRLARESQDSIADVGTYAGEIIQNIKVVQSYTRESQEKKAFGAEVENAFSVARQRVQQRAVLIAAVIFLAFGAISIMLWVGGMDVLAGRISEGELAAFVFYAVMVAMSVATISEVYGELQRASGSAERLFELLAVESAIQAPQQVVKVDSSAETVIAFDAVNFSYPSRLNSAALSEITLSIRKGQVVALVGPSGAGKTTLFELLQRFYDPSSGEIRLKGAPIHRLEPQALRQQMGMVPQQPIMFSADVWHNIRYGRPDASDEEVILAAKRAHAHDFILELPEGYKSYLGEQGVRLSGGQKQRVALARAILKDPDILLLDEATSALDAESEFHVQAALNELMENRTTLIIAHRLSTVIHADVIVLLDQGRIVARGTHSQLLEESTLYQRLCELQFDTSDTERNRQM